jgi:hypothetical protein
MPSYIQSTDANADMLRNAEKMYRADAENTALTRGIGADELDKQESLKAINQKLNMIREEKAKALIEKEKEYNRDTTVLQSLYDNQMKSEIVLEKQNREMNRNNTKIGNIKQDVLTLRRQVEIAQDETWRRNNKLFLLKTLFTFLLGVMIPLILLKNDKISQKVAAISMTVMLILFTLAVLWNLFHGKNRNSLRYNLRHWPSPRLSDIIDEEDEDDINNEVESSVERQRKKEKGEVMKFLSEVKLDFKKSLRNKNYREAADLQEIIDKLISGLKDGNSFGGFDNLEQLQQFIKTYKKTQASGYEEQKTALMKKMNELKMKQDTNKSHIDKLKKDYQRERKETNIVKKDLRGAKRDAYNLTKNIRKTKSSLGKYL